VGEAYVRVKEGVGVGGGGGDRGWGGGGGEWGEGLIFKVPANIGQNIFKYTYFVQIRIIMF